MATPKKSLAVTEVFNMHFGFPLNTELGRPKVAEGRDELKQSLLLRLMERKGDWFFDPDFGVPWVDDPDLGIAGIMGTKPPMPPALIEAFIRDELDKEDRVTEVRNMDIVIDSERNVSIDMDVQPVDLPPFRLQTVI